MSGLENLRGEDTFPKLLVRNAHRHPARTALREKDLGIWQPISWQGYLDAVREWVVAELAAQAMGAASVGVYQDSTLHEVAFVLDHCDAEIVVAEDQEQVDKILDMLERLPKVRHVVYTDPRGLRGYRHPSLSSFEAVREKGRAVLAHQPRLFEEEVAKGAADDLAIISYTSGTTGFPKGAMLSFRNLLAMALALHEVDPKRPADEFVSFLPLAWIGEQMMSLSSALALGFTVNFPEAPGTMMENVREIGPHVMFAPPRVWEGMVSSVQVRIMDTTPFKRFMYERLMPLGYAVADRRFSGKPVGAGWRLLYWLAYLLLFRALKDRLGLSRLRTASTGGAALGPDVFRFFHGIGVPLKQIYGQTEIAGISCIHREDDIRFHTVGEPIPGTELSISEAGEILSRSPSVFLGYYKNEAASGEVVREGWLHSGDAGHLEDGHLVVIDRLKDVMRLADGTRFSPQFIENRLKFSPYVKEAVVIGQDRPYLCALLCIDMGIVGKWAEKQKIGYTTYADLSSRTQVYDLVEKEVEQVNGTLPPAARVRKFVLLYKELDADDDELTRTRKVKRNVVEERYGDVIAAVYGERQAVDIDATIKFQDGKTARVQAKLPVRELLRKVA